jgi:hypothetical protein
MTDDKSHRKQERINRECTQIYLTLQAQDLSGPSYNHQVIAAEREAKQYFASHQPIVRDDALNNDYTADIGIAGPRP